MHMGTCVYGPFSGPPAARPPPHASGIGAASHRQAPPSVDPVEAATVGFDLAKVPLKARDLPAQHGGIKNL